MDNPEESVMDGDFFSSESRCHNLFNNLPFAILIFQNDALRTVLRCNPSAQQLLLQKEQALVGKPLKQLIPAFAEAANEALLQQVIQDGAPVSFPTIIARDGAATLSLRGTLLLSCDNDLALVLEDASPVRFAAIALQEGEERFRSVMAAIADAIVAIDREGRVIFWNRGAEELFGYTLEEIQGEPVTKLMPERYVSRHDAAFGKTRDHGLSNLSARPAELHIRRKDGTERAVELVFSQWNSLNGINYLGVFRDITQRRKMESDLRHMHKMDALGVMAGGISHDFNNILGVIIGYAEISMDVVPEDNPVRRYMEEILNAGLRARDLVGQLLTFSRQTEVVERPIMLGPIVKEGIRLVRSTIPTTITFQTDIRGQGGPVLADPTQIFQILLNLCNNAEYAMRSKTGILRIEMQEVGSEEVPGGDQQVERYIRLAVMDTGDGIPSSIRDRIFDPFFTTKKVGDGTGLGLSVVHSIVKQHGGLLNVESKDGVGTQLSIFLPKIKGKTAEAEPKSRRVRPVSPLLEGRSVLIVDDDIHLLETNRRMLETLQMDVVVTSDPIEALDLFLSAPDRFDIMLTDYAMPRLTGVALAQKIGELRPHLPKILCTGYAAAVSEIDLHSLGFCGLLRKPYMFEQLVAMLEKGLSGKVLL